MVKQKLFLAGFLLVITLISCESREARKYFDDLNLKLTGKILYINHPPSANNFAVVGVSIIHTNIDLYDPRKGRDYYYCVIMNNQAEFYQGDTRECEIGDTIDVDTERRSFSVRKGNAPPQEKGMILYTNEQFYKYVRKHYQKF